MAQRILQILVILAVLFVISDAHWWRRKKHHKRHCPSRDDVEHVCCDKKTHTITVKINECKRCTAPTKENPSCWIVQTSKKVKYWCWYSYLKNLTVTTCEPKCCEGWTVDEDGRCTKRIDEQPIVCENGGSPNGDHCICPTGFSGKNCETSICNPSCLNGGICTGRDGKAVCVCPEGQFRGEQCEIPICTPECKNGGTCTGHYMSTCTCPPGYTGTACEHKEKDGECPETSGIGACAFMCSVDSDCGSGTKKCCKNGCGTSCMYPAKSQCIYNGTYYNIGHFLHMTPCKPCFCSYPDKYGDYQWECTHYDCPQLRCERTKHIPGSCCPVCEDIPTTTRPTTTPRIPTTTPPTCTENGTEHPVGARISRNNGCQICTCGSSRADAKGRLFPVEWHCMVIDCFGYPGCENLRYIPGQCCPVCDDMATPVPTTKRPTTKQPYCYLKNGTAYSHLSTIQKAPCQNCTCRYKYGGYLDWECTPPPVCTKADCENPVWIPGRCCPVCIGTTTTAAPNYGPAFSNCPGQMQTLNTHKERFVDIRKELNLKAFDRNGREYSVKYTKEMIYAEPCNCRKNTHMISAYSEPDRYGQRAECHFQVHVYDNHSPIYNTCPSNIAAFEDELIVWDKPSAVDNVGIASESLTSKFKNNTIFAEGSYAVLYVARDHQHNIGICKFVVAIFKRGTTDPTAPLELKNEDKEDKKLINVVIGVLSALIVLTIAVILTACYIRRKRNAEQQAEPTNAYDNAIYATPSTPPPSYERSLAAKLPPKYIEKDEKPPVYEELDVKVVGKKGVQNPTYDSTDELEVGQIKMTMKEDA